MGLPVGDRRRGLRAEGVQGDPDCLPLYDVDLGRRPPARPQPAGSLPGLLAQAIRAFELDFGSACPVPMALCGNLLRVLLADDAVPLKDLAVRTGLAKDGVEGGLRALERRKLVTVGASPAGGRLRVASLTRAGAERGRQAAELTGSVEESWPKRYGRRRVAALDDVLAAIAGDPDDPGGPPAQRGYQPQASEHPLAAPEQHGFAHALARSPFIGFIPWLLYRVIGGPSTWETAAIAALLASVLLTVLSIEQHPFLSTSGNAAPGGWLDFRRLKVLEVATVVFFAALVIVALVTSRPDVAALDRYSQALSSGALGLIALGSILVGHPFTVDYAKEQTAPQVWRTAAFKQINLVLTGVWAAVFLVCAGLGLWSAHVATKGLQDALNWYIPIVLVVIAVRMNTWYPNYVRSKIRRPTLA